MTNGEAIKNSLAQGGCRSVGHVKKRGIMLIFDPFSSFFSKFRPSMRNLMRLVLGG